MKHKLTVEQRQLLSQNQISSLELLALCNSELSRYMENEYMENPLLEQTSLFVPVMDFPYIHFPYTCSAHCCIMRAIPVKISGFEIAADVVQQLIYVSWQPPFATIALEILYHTAD